MGWQGSLMGTSICGNFAPIPEIPGANPSTVEFTLNPEIVEVILNPDTLEATLNPKTRDATFIHPEVKIIPPGLSPATLYNQAASNANAETRTEVESCEVSPITSN